MLDLTRFDGSESQISISGITLDLTTSSFCIYNRACKSKNITLASTYFLQACTPVMNGYTTPYGVVEAFAEFSAAYPAWEGMNNAVSSTNTWVCPVYENAEIDPSNKEAWYKWYLTDDNLNVDGLPMMYPKDLTIRPRGSMAGSWYAENNPKRLAIYGLDENFNEIELIAEWYDPNWNGNGMRTWDLRGLSPVPLRGFKIYILGTQNWENGSNFHTGWSDLKMCGSYDPDVCSESVGGYDGDEFNDGAGGKEDYAWKDTCKMFTGDDTLRVLIRYWTTDDIIMNAKIYSEGGVANIRDNGDGSYDLYSSDPLKFIGISSSEYGYYGNYAYSVTKIEVFAGDTLEYFIADYDESIGIAPFAGMTIMTEFIWHGKCSPTSMRFMLYECLELPTVDLSSFDVSNVTNMEYMAGKCQKLSYIKMPSNIVTVKPTCNMSKIFYKNHDLVCIDLLDTTNATDKTNMFYECNNLIAPDVTTQDDLTDADGAEWVNPNPCP